MHFIYKGFKVIPDGFFYCSNGNLGKIKMQKKKKVQLFCFFMQNVSYFFLLIFGVSWISWPLLWDSAEYPEQTLSLAVQF